VRGLEIANFDELETTVLLGLNFGGRVFQFGDEFLEMRVRVEVLQIIVGHQAISVLIAAVDGFV
jgi:hypothetical protein